LTGMCANFGMDSRLHAQGRYGASLLRTDGVHSS
jgi:hypothetical protein